MFTGIVQGVGEIITKTSVNTVTSLIIKLPDVERLTIGASVSINGVCLTVVSIDSDNVQFDVIDETLSLTNLKQIKKGTKVNLERSMTVNTEIGGHLLSGHIHCEGTISKITKVSNQTKDMLITLPPNMMKYIFFKGYIGINGCSLTIGKVNKNSFFIHLI